MGSAARLLSGRPPSSSTRAGGRPRAARQILALLFLRNRRRDPCAERVAIELDRRRTPAELAAISADQADALAGVIHAVLDGIGLSGEQRERALAIAATELRRAAGEEP